MAKVLVVIHLCADQNGDEEAQHEAQGAEGWYTHHELEAGCAQCFFKLFPLDLIRNGESRSVEWSKRTNTAD